MLHFLACWPRNKPGRLLGIQHDSGILGIDVFRRVYETTTSQLARAIADSIPRRFHSLLYRVVASTAIVSWDIPRIRDEALLNWLYRVSSRAIPVDSGCGLRVLVRGAHE